jgi:2',3'-cyclic-nucleotide 2'-phosphodiesterase
VFRTAEAGTVGVINLIGRVFMDPADCPFRTAMGLVEELSRQCDAIVVDIHAEATSEKQAMGWYLDGRVSAVIGTHTHVQTADERVLPGGTAFITDVGMTGPTETVIGATTDIIVKRFLSGLPAKFEVPKSGASELCALWVETEPQGMRARAVRRVRVLTDGAESV